MEIRRDIFVRLGFDAPDWRAAIYEVAEMLQQSGACRDGLGASMERREAVSATYLGSGVAIPHALGADKDLAERDAIAVLQLRQGIAWSGGETVNLVVGIAAKSDSHLTILQRLTRLVQDPEALRRLVDTDDEREIVAALDPATEAEDDSAGLSDFEHSREWVVPFASGLHVRPATRLMTAAKDAASPIRLRSGKTVADARSLIQLLQLGLRHGDRVFISSEGGHGPDTLAAFLKVAEAVALEEEAELPVLKPTPIAAKPHWRSPDGSSFISGVRASPGFAIGRVKLFSNVAPDVADEPDSPASSSARLSTAISIARRELLELSERMVIRVGEAEARIIAGQAELLDDVEIVGKACALVAAGHGVAWAWQEAIKSVSSELERLDSPVLAARAIDLRDVGRRVQAHLSSSVVIAEATGDDHSERLIVVADELSPSDLAALDGRDIAGICDAAGGPTSHSAILARTLGIPTLVACGPELLNIGSGDMVVLAADDGRVFPMPSQADLAAATAFLASSSEVRKRERLERHRPARTLDGIDIAIAANVNRPTDVIQAQEQGAEGVGLMRTEFLLLGRSASPDEEEQTAIYAEMIKAVGSNPLIIRTFDIGGDKPIPYLNLPAEANPFLGVRGTRLLLRKPDLMDTQLRAIYRAAGDGGDVAIMFPMITTPEEMAIVRARCEACRIAVGGRLLPVGAMIEVPAAALHAASLAEHCDFFSIGSNDLTQYSLAIDRQNATLAGQADALDPAVLKLIHQTVQGASRNGRWVGVCGGVAGDPDGAALLVGLGVTELSMTPADIPAVKQRLRSSSASGLASIAAKALEAASANEVRALLRADQ